MCLAKTEYTLMKSGKTNAVVRQQELWCCAAGRPGVTGKVKEVTRMESTGMKRCDGDYLALERLKTGVGVEHTQKLQQTAL